MLKLWKNERFKVILFYAVLTIVLTWPFAWNFFSSVPSLGPDTMQVIGVAGERANVLKDFGLLNGTFELLKRSEFNIVTLYAFFELIFGRIAGYNLLFLASFVLSGFGMYLLAYYFTKNKPASLVAGIIFAFSPFHVHNSLSTNVGTMHQEWLPFFALYLFKFFEDLKIKNFILAGIFLGLIAFTEHQLLAFTLVFVFLFIVYKIFTRPKVFLKAKFWLFAAVGAAVLSVVFFFMFRSLFEIAFSQNNYLDPGFKAAVKYSNDSLAVFVPPNFHSFWPNAFSGLRETFQRRIDSSFSVYAGFLALILSLVAFFRDRVSKKWFWLAVALGFYILSLGPYLHFKGEIEPPVKMPYLLAYNYLPFFNNIRTVGRLFVYSMLAFSVLAAWGIAYFQNILQKKGQRPKAKGQNDERNISTGEHESGGWQISRKTKAFYFIVSLIIIVEYLAIPLKTNTLLHSSFYEKLGRDKEEYSIIEVPGSTDYGFASRDLVWKSIHRKNTVNGYDFARVIEDHYTFQRGTPIIRTLLYDIPEGNEKNNDRDMMKDSYYSISNEILTYYGIRYVILDKEGLAGNPGKGEANKFYSAKPYVQNVIECASEFEDDFLYACEVDREVAMEHMFVAMDYSNKHWVGKDKGKEGIRRWAESGAGVKIVNMSQTVQKGKFNFKVKLYKPLRVKAFLNGEQIYDKYIAQISEKTNISVDVQSIRPGENDVIFEVLAADGNEIRSEKKSDVVTIYDVEVE